MSKLLGLRVIANTEGGEEWGVARMRYTIPHRHCRSYEIERPDGSAFLAEYTACRPAPNWDETPEEHRFTGSEFYQPQFLEGATRQHAPTFGRDTGVVIPSDMDRLRELISTIRPGAEVKWENHGANEFRGLVTVEHVDDKGVRVTAPKGAPTRCDWPTEGVEIGPQYGHEFQVDGNTLHFFLVPPKRTGKGPRRSLSLTFR